MYFDHQMLSVDQLHAVQAAYMCSGCECGLHHGMCKYTKLH